MLKKRGDVLYLGFDESNHGRNPEIVVAVASFNYQDSLIFPNQERIRKELRLFSSLKIRDYRYCLIPEEDFKKHSLRNIIPSVYSRLVSAFGADYEFLKLYIDGDFGLDQRKLLEELIAEEHDFPAQSILIKQIPKREGKSTNYLIALADGWANWIYKRIVKQKITEGMKKRKADFCCSQIPCQ